MDNEELSFDNKKSTIHNDDDDDTERSWITSSESEKRTNTYDDDFNYDS
jgi:hypothetical protein